MALLVLVTSAEGPPSEDFIAAFDVPAAQGFDVLWPHPSLPRFSGSEVRVVVEAMPRGRGPRGPEEDLRASRHLLFNGRRLEPRTSRPSPRGAPPVEEFRVPLKLGRLRLTLRPPVGFRIDPLADRLAIRIRSADGVVSR